MGECSLIPGLSIESEEEVRSFLETLTTHQGVNVREIPLTLPSVRFAVETALRSLKRGGDANWPGGITINGLVWMDSVKGMLEQVEILVNKGFKTIKLKVGTLPFHEELEMLREIRRKCPAEEFTLRIDANGAFGKDAGDGMSAIEKLEALSKAELDIHSIEQPIPAGQYDKMATLCATSPIPIALDEELIGVTSQSERRALLEKTKPKYLILKPSLIGGLEESEKWIELAHELGIGWWVTSALESNVGLSAIAEWVAGLLEKKPKLEQLAQGLGTGGLFTNNTASTMYIEDGKLYAQQQQPGEIVLHGHTFPLSADGATDFAAHIGRPSWTDGIARTLVDWFQNPESPLLFKTSGSSGTPRKISHTRESVISSAKDSLTFFGLKPGTRAVLALPIEFVAGRLMLVRAIVGRWNLEIIEPTSRPVCTNALDFIALTPLQCASLLSDFPVVSKVLLGGGVVREGLKKKLPNGIEFWEGFGMTETLTHIAARRVISEKTNPPFTALPGVNFETNPEGILVINAPNRGVVGLVTDDLVELIDAQNFSWLGRKSAVINSGGMKVIPEVVEREIRSIMRPLDCAYLIRGIEDEALGEKVVLRLDSKKLTQDDEGALLRKIASLETLPPYHTPRGIEYGAIKTSILGKTQRNLIPNKMKPTIVFATANENKVSEVRRLLEGRFEVKSLADIGCLEDIPETALTLEGNAKQKADYVKEKYGFDCFADDTGLEVEALNGAPGVYTARFGGPQKDATQNMNHLLSELHSAGATESKDRQAQFKTAIHLIVGGEAIALEGICKGEIAQERSGTEGFGYDPIFIPEGETRTFSEMNADEKNAISHRGKAILKMTERLGV